MINNAAPDVLAVQEVGDPAALDDLVSRLEGDWHLALSQVFDQRHPMRVGMISKLPISYVDDVSALPAELVPIRVRDREPDGSSAAVSEPAGTDTITTMRRGALRGRIEVTDEGLDVVVCHLKSKLLSYPGGRFQPHDEGERARYAGYALDERAAEAVAVRTFANEILAGHGQDRALVVLGDLNDEAAASTTQILLGPPVLRSARRDTRSPTRATPGDSGISPRASTQPLALRRTTVRRSPAPPATRLS